MLNFFIKIAEIKKPELIQAIIKKILVKVAVISILSLPEDWIV